MPDGSAIGEAVLEVIAPDAVTRSVRITQSPDAAQPETTYSFPTAIYPAALQPFVSMTATTSKTAASGAVSSSTDKKSTNTLRIGDDRKAELKSTTTLHNFAQSARHRGD